MAVSLRDKDRRWLQEVADLTDNRGGSMYPGMHADVMPPTVAKRLRGLIDVYEPHNMAHKNRWIITTAGRHALAAN